MGIHATIWISACCAVTLLCGAAHVQAACPQGWTLFNNRCFKLVTKPDTFHRAQGVCEVENSHLTSVHSAAELNFLQNVVRASGVSQQGAWLGGSDAGSEGTWYWIDGSPFDFADWAEFNHGQPDNSGGDEDCLMLTPDGNLRFNDLRCGATWPFICSRRSRRPQITDVISCSP